MSVRLALSIVLSVLALGGCGEDRPDGIDFEPGDLPDGDNNDNAPPGHVTLRGEVAAVDRITGTPLSDEEYAERAGGMLLYVLDDPTNLADPIAKFTFALPSSWETYVPEGFGDVWVSVVVDNGDYLINSADMVREYPGNPVQVGGQAVSDLDIVIDLPAPGEPFNDSNDTGSGSQPPVTGLSGSIVLDEVEFGDEFTLGSIGNVLVYATSLDFTEGPWGIRIREGAGPFATAVRDSSGPVALVAYFDRDDNGFFEPSDPLGVPLNNQFELGEGDIDGIIIGIPTAPDEAVTLPASYVQLHAEVLYSDFSSGDIHIFATAGSVAGPEYGSLTIGVPATFALRVPAWTPDMYLWAVVDEDGDGQWDLEEDPHGVFGPIETQDEDLWDLDVIIGTGDSSATFSGTFSYEGPVGPDDTLWVTLLDPNFAGPPVEVELVNSPTMPYNYSFSVEAGTYFPAGYIDFGGDNPAGPVGDEPQGSGAAVTVPQGGVSTGNNVTLAVP